MKNKQSEKVKTLKPSSGYSLLRIVIDPSKDPRGPKMLFKSFEPFVKNDYHGINFIMCSVINERNNFNPDAFSGEIEVNEPLENES